MFGDETGVFGPEGEPCAAPIETNVPAGWCIAWEDCGSCYKLKLYPLDVHKEYTRIYIDRDSLAVAQESVDDLIKHYRG